MAEVFSDWLVDRPDVFVTSKVWPVGEDMPLDQEIRQAAKDTLAGLKVDYLDLYLLPADRHSKALQVWQMSAWVAGHITPYQAGQTGAGGPSWGLCSWSLTPLVCTEGGGGPLWGWCSWSLTPLVCTGRGRVGRGNVCLVELAAR